MVVSVGKYLANGGIRFFGQLFRLLERCFVRDALSFFNNMQYCHVFRLIRFKCICRSKGVVLIGNWQEYVIEQFVVITGVHSDQ